MQAAASRGHTGIVKLLFKYATDANIGGHFGSVLQMAVAYSLPDVDTLLEGGADVNFQGGQYDTALHAAASRGHTGIVQLLLEHGADVTIGGLLGAALHVALTHGHTEVVELLVRGGAAVNL